MAQDQTRTDDLHFTQALLANMLGARRATVTEVAGSLQRKGLIKYHRGHVIIRDRDGLERAACQCYQVIKELRGDLYHMFISMSRARSPLLAGGGDLDELVLDECVIGGIGCEVL